MSAIHPLWARVAAATLPRLSSVVAVPPVLPGGARALGLQLANPLGLAAGFDRDGRLAGRLGFAGFGFVEVGTVTRAHANVASALARAPRSAQRIGVSIGSDGDGLGAAALDEYRGGLRVFWPHADYLVANLTSPTAPLRAEARGERLLRFLSALRVDANRLALASGRRVPFLVKMRAARADALDAAGALGLDGVVVVSEPGDGVDLAALVARLAPMAVVSVGGVRSASDARARLAAGAALVQVYGAFTQRGPWFVRRMVSDLVAKASA